MIAKIGIDPGHGGSSSGTYSVKSTADGLFEKDFALELGLMIEEKLALNGFKVVMTRREDKNPGTVTKRAEKMIGENVDFALSVHFNGFNNSSANGTEIFVPYGEKYADVESGLYTALGKYFKIRNPFARSSDYYNRNDIFDKKLDINTKKFGAVENKNDYFGFIRTCWEKGVSADLLEICFLTNPEDFENYQKNKEKIADDIARSIVEGFGEKYHSMENVTAKKMKPRIAVKGTDFLFGEGVLLP